MENKPILSQSLASVDNLDSSIRAASGYLQSIKKRHVLAVYAFFGFFIAYTLRANLSVAIVDMAHVNFHTVSPPPITSDFQTSVTSSLNEENTTTTTTTRVPEIEKSEPWSPVLQGYILASFFYGYIVTQFPAGMSPNIKNYIVSFVFFLY